MEIAADRIDDLLLDLRRISKTFGGSTALDQVDFQLREGEVHGLVGENGAGKSTLMKILAGVHTRYQGELRLRGLPAKFHSPKSAKAHGISMIYQELSSVGCLSVAENLMLGREPRTFGIINWREIYRRAREELGELGIEIDVRALVEDLPLGLQQIVEIARVIHSGADVLIMDEPTSALSATETQQLFKIVQTLKQKKKSVIFISHFMDDVLAICDRVTILRNARNVATLETKGLAKHVVIGHMLGKNTDAMTETGEKPVKLCCDFTSPIVLEVRNATRGNRLTDVTFTVGEGEILGLYGALGSGHALMGECLFGLKQLDKGDIVLDGRRLSRHRPATAKTRGMAYVSPDRTASLFLDAEIYKNVTVSFLDRLMSWIINRRRELSISDDVIGLYGVKGAASTAPLSSLSGGNQQKIALARWLVCPIRLLILNEPTRGMDVGAKDEVMRIIKELKREKMGIILISSEPETVMANADRILVFSKGRISAEFSNRAVTKDMLMQF